MVHVYRIRDLDALVLAAAQRFVDVVSGIQSTGRGVHHDGIARVVLTGGTAGIRTLDKLREFDEAVRAYDGDYPGQVVDWSRVHVFFGDERNVALTDADSNEGQARRALLDHVDIPADHIHGYGLGDRDLDEAVEAYALALDRFAPEGFDLHLLGMGGEGHINTLFPGTDAVKETKRLVVAEYASPKPPAQRGTLTLPAVARAQRVWLLVSGAEKAEAAGHVAAGADPVEWPAAGARGHAETVLFVTEDASRDIALTATS
ncbi:6-phosphogluconolactonase [Corynebacterium uterequi]|uniref:6-phosphogluconolactonase n=1 Tax=Corynebacterium uterequi TaxID=1072256 RepID=A0A0G3HEM2_9CORY|nr:6-phosphogluconolactonase [Corynebacterium uterequi]AKK11160.1 6-phosphogluconolactonase [Corynebacterium uterequi]